MRWFTTLLVMLATALQAAAQDQSDTGSEAVDPIILPPDFFHFDDQTDVNEDNTTLHQPASGEQDPDGGLIGYQSLAAIRTYYRIELLTPGGPLPFILEREYMMQQPHIPVERFFEKKSEWQPAADLWYLCNGKERVQVDVDHRIIIVSSSSFPEQERDLVNAIGATRGINELRINMPEYDANVVWREPRSGRINDASTQPGVLLGEYQKERGSGIATVPALIYPLNQVVSRFDELEWIRLQSTNGKVTYVVEEPTPIEFSGRYRVKFSSSDEEAVAIFEQDEDLITGTFLTTTGDYRFLEGRIDSDIMRLSCFDGAHAFLFHAQMQDDGTITGDFWSGNWWHETWTATRDDNATLPDGFTLTTFTGDTQDFDDITFTDLEGNPTTIADAIERARDDTDAAPTLIKVFGSWCPNCHDAAAYLAELDAKYADRGLRIVCLAFELTDDFERSAQQVQRFHDRHDFHPLTLIAGVSPKDAASKRLPFLDAVRSYPTTIFLDAKGEPRFVYQGFTGPAAEKEHADLREAWESRIEKLLDEAGR